MTIPVKLMNEYGVDMPLWHDGCQTDAEDLPISATLRTDLAAFARRWERSIPADVFDDRFDHLPVVRRVVGGVRSAKNALDRAGRRAAAQEDEALRALGHRLRDRLADELGPGYAVTYRH